MSLPLHMKFYKQNRTACFSLELTVLHSVSYLFQRFIHVAPQELYLLCLHRRLAFQSMILAKGLSSASAIL